MKTIVFDTETTGLPHGNVFSYACNDYTITPYTLPNFPYIMQLSYAIYNHKTKTIEKMVDHIVKIDDRVEISEGALQIHGITREMTQQRGIPIETVIHDIFKQIQIGFKKGYNLIGHNIIFDLAMLKAAIMRLIYDNAEKNQFTREQLRVFKTYMYTLCNYPKDKLICTMNTTTDFCELPSLRYTNRFKPPKLVELHKVLFHQTPNSLHNSLYDALITIRCFIKYRYNIDIIDTCTEFRKHAKQLYDIDFPPPVLRRSERIRLMMERKKMVL